MNKDAIKRGWHYNAVTGNLEAYNNGNEIFQYPYGTNYYVSKSGADTNSGLSWAQSKLTIQAALTLARTVGTATTRRGGVKIYVAPGAYAENLITPLNTETPFGTLQAISPTSRSRGAVYLTAPTTTSPCLTIRARGWRISGFEFDAPASTGGCILLDGTTANSNAKFAEIDNCLFNGAYNTSDIGIDANEASPLVVIRDCDFIAFYGRAITTTDCYAMFWQIYRCYFNNNDRHIAPKNSKGFQGAWIHDNSFFQGSRMVIGMDMRGGSQNHIGPNNFLGGTYSNGGGYYAASGDLWYGNICSASHQATNPA